MYHVYKDKIEREYQELPWYANIFTPKPNIHFESFAIQIKKHSMKKVLYFNPGVKSWIIDKESIWVFAMFNWISLVFNKEIWLQLNVMKDFNENICQLMNWF